MAKGVSVVLTLALDANLIGDGGQQPANAKHAGRVRLSLFVLTARSHGFHSHAALGLAVQREHAAEAAVCDACGNERGVLSAAFGHLDGLACAVELILLEQRPQIVAAGMQLGERELSIGLTRVVVPIAAFATQREQHTGNGAACGVLYLESRQSEKIY